MHREELEYGLGQYMPVGEGGAYLPTSGLAAPGGVDSSALMGGSVGGTLSDLSMQASISSGGGGGVTGYGAQAGVNAGYARAANSPIGASRYIAKGSIAGINATLANAAYDPMGVYGIPPGGGIPPRTIAGTPPLSPGNLSYQAGDLGYRAQELSGIYGFMLGSARESLGFGSNDFSSRTPILASSSMAYGSTRSFWDLNLGGLGDAPLPLEGNFANLEFSEIMRRFIPKERSANEVINPIPNDMGKMYPWLPGPEYFTNFRQGDPFTSIDEGEMRLPGQGYERLHRLHSDRMGKYGLVDQYKILADVAPWSPQYKALNSQLNGSNIPESWREEIETTREQVAMRNQKYNFSPYKYKYSNAEDLGLNPIDFQFRKAFEQIGHNNTYINTKFLPYRTATEDWERENVYGSTFPQWQHPIKDFLKPMVYNASQRNPIAGAFFLGTAGRFFGVSPQAKNVASVIGGGIGLAAGGAETIHSFFTGERYMPATRRKELAVEEYTDILKYVQGMRNYGLAKEAGDPNAAAEYKSQAQQTMFGADIFNANLSQLSMAIPKRKREHFKELINAPVEERKQILSTAGRLERRIYEAAWGMPVEERPNLEDYFSEHELPNSAWEGWHPNTNLEQVKVKIGQNLGLDMSQMGYYPQQIREANLINPSYPDFRMHSNKANVHAQLRGLLQSSGIYGDVVPVITPYPGTRVQINAGVG